MNRQRVFSFGKSSHSRSKSAADASDLQCPSPLFSAPPVPPSPSFRVTSQESATSQKESARMSLPPLQVPRRDVHFGPAPPSPSASSITSPASPLVPNVPHELVPIITLLNAQAARVYAEGSFLFLRDKESTLRPRQEHEWSRVHGRLQGTELCLYYVDDDVEDSGISDERRGANGGAFAASNTAFGSSDSAFGQYGQFGEPIGSSNNGNSSQFTPNIDSHSNPHSSSHSHSHSPSSAGTQRPARLAHRMNVADSFVKAYQSLRTEDGAELSQLLALSPTWKTRYLLQFATPDAFHYWHAALRLAVYEWNSLNEAYTAAVLACKGSLLPDVQTVLGRTRFKRGEWVDVRFEGGGSPWVRCYAVVTPSEHRRTHSRSASAADSSTGLVGSPSTIFGSPSSPSVFSRFFRGNRSASGVSAASGGSENSTGSTVSFGDTPKYKVKKLGRIDFYSSEKTNKKHLLASVTRLDACFAVYPSLPQLIDSSAVLKMSGGIEMLSGESTVPLRSIYVIPKEHGSVKGYETMIRFLLPVYDAFFLYGRPTRLAASRANPQSLLFAMPVLPKSHYLEVETVVAELVREAQPDLTERQWTELLRGYLAEQIRSVGHDGVGSVTRVLSPRLESAAVFGTPMAQSWSSVGSEGSGDVDSAHGTPVQGLSSVAQQIMTDGHVSPPKNVQTDTPASAASAVTAATAASPVSYTTASPRLSPMKSYGNLADPGEPGTRTSAGLFNQSPREPSSPLSNPPLNSGHSASRDGSPRKPSRLSYGASMSEPERELSAGLGGVVISGVPTVLGEPCELRSES